MYKVRNISLDSIFKEYSISKLEELDNEKLKEVCKKVKTEPVWKLMQVRNKVTNRTTGYRRTEFDKYSTIDKILGENSVSIYMGEAYWQERHLMLDSELEIKEKLSKMMDGNQVMGLMERVGLGINNLRPNEEKECDWTDEWIEDVLKKHPTYEKLKVEKIGKEVEPITKEIEKKEVFQLQKKEFLTEEVKKPKEEKESDLSLLDYKALKAIGKNYGIKVFGMTKEDLVEQIQKKFKDLKE